MEGSKQESASKEEAPSLSSNDLSVVVEEEAGRRGDGTNTNTRSVEFSEHIAEIPSSDKEEQDGDNDDEEEGGRKMKKRQSNNRWSILSIVGSHHHHRRIHRRRNTVQSNTLAGELKFVEKVARAAPRTYFFFFFVVFPLFALIGFSFVFGYGLAKLESSKEIDANDETLRGLLFETYQEHVEKQELIRESIETIYPQCIVSYDNNVTFDALETMDPGLFPYLNRCSNAQALLEYPTTSGAEFYEDSYQLALDFNWISCPRAALEFLDERELAGEDIPNVDRVLQTVQYKVEFYKSFLANLNATMTSNPGMTEEEARPLAMERSTGSSNCKANAAAGTFYFFAVLTTIGSSQPAPTTTGGRALIYSFGFLSIVAFLGLLAQAGYLTVTIVDDFAKRCLGLPFLTRGFPSVVLWFCLFLCYILILSGCFISYMGGHVEDGTDGDVSLGDAFWFAFMTMTTVGVSDKAFPPSEFVGADMFLLPLLILFGFVLVAIFAFKLGSFISELVPRDMTLEDLLEKEQQLRKEAQQEEDQQEQQSPTVQTEQRDQDDNGKNDQQAATNQNNEEAESESNKGV